MGSSIASPVCTRKKVSTPSGEVTSPMWLDTSPPPPSTSPWKMPSKELSLKESTPTTKNFNISSEIFFQEELPELSVFQSCILLILPEPDWALISEKTLNKGNSPVWVIALWKLSRLMVLPDFIKVSVCPWWEFSCTEPSTSEDMTQVKDGSSVMIRPRVKPTFSSASSSPNLLYPPVKPFHSLWILLEENWWCSLAEKELTLKLSTQVLLTASRKPLPKKALPVSLKETWVIFGDPLDLVWC